MSPSSKRADHPALARLGKAVRALRQGQTMTLQDLARRAQLSLRFVSELEAGRANISILNLMEVAAALGVTPTVLLDGPEAVPPRGVISLLGLRGAGKTTVGKRLADKLGRPFFELDRLVEGQAGMSLSEIFAIHGESYFRKVELTALRRFLAGHERAVIAAGGGLVASPEAFALLLERTQTIWLRATAEEHWERVVEQGDLRPIRDRPHAMAELRRRLREREPLYAKASMTCTTSGRPVDAVVAELAQAL